MTDIQRDDLALAFRLVDLADQQTMAAFGTDLRVSGKPDGSLVSSVDVAIERSLRAELEVHRQADGFVGEETTPLIGSQVIVEEAGGSLTDTSGVVRVDADCAVVTNGLLHEEVLAILTHGRLHAAVGQEPAQRVRGDSLLAKVSSPRLPSITMSPSAGVS